MDTTPTTPRSSTLFFGFALAALAGAALALLLNEYRVQAKTQALNETQEALRLADETMAIQRELNRKLEARLVELSVTHTNAGPLTLAPPAAKVAEVEAPKPVVEPARWTAANAAHLQAQLPEPAVKLVSNGRQEQKIYTFAQLPAADGHNLMTGAEYRGAIGRKLMFRTGGSVARSFDYSELHPGVLAHLSLEPVDLLTQQAALDDKKTQAEYAAQKAREAKAAAEKKYQEARLAARLVQTRIASEQKKVEQEENLRLQALETERMKAEAAMLQAEAAMEKARNPQPVLLFDTKHMGLAPLVNPQVR
jgi:hypothetical protein